MIATFEAISAEKLRAWCDTAGDDWLKTAVGERLDEESDFGCAVGVGMYARLLIPTHSPKATSRKARVEAILNGYVPPFVQRSVEWTASLSAAQRRTIIDLSLAEADLIKARVDMLAESMDCGENGWWNQLAMLCTARDDLESVRRLFGDSVDARSIDACIAPVDVTARRFIGSIPVRRSLIDEQLRRAAMTEPLAWWTALVAVAV